MKRKGDWIQTWSGKMFWPLDPRPEDIDINDIANALGKICRFTGHCTHFYSVAEHSVNVSEFLPQRLALAGLLHDASEAYLCDIPRPIKPLLNGYKQIERNVEWVIFKTFGLEYPIDIEVKRIDTAILADEESQLMVSAPAKWYLPEKPLGIELNCYSPQKAIELFLNRFNELTEAK